MKHVEAAYEELIDAESMFYAAYNAEDMERAEDIWPVLEYLEHDVWVAFAECTITANPELIFEVAAEAPRPLCLSMREFLEDRFKGV